ncbi:MAG: thioredoxin reductase [Solirubrobacteraceae bacterium]|nr:thioredoxin reductase [Solirubrobacteraceae bacterium]
MDAATPTQSPPETPDDDGAYPRLGELQIDALSRDGERRRTEAGEVLFRQGERDYDFVVVLEGKVLVCDGDGPDARVIAVHGPGRFLGELSLLSRQAAFYTTVVAEPGEVLVVPVERLRERVLLDPALGDLILRAYLLRRERLIGLGAGLQIVGSHYSPEARRLREFTARNRLPHRWIDLEEDPEAETLLRHLGVAPEDTPVVIWAGQVLRNPSTVELARAVGLKLPRAPATTVDLVVVGAGPAGIAASVYGASEGLATVVLDAMAVGGQAATTSRIENYLGFPSGISGPELAERGTIQAEKFGVDINVPCTTIGLEQRDGQYVLRYDDSKQVATRAVVVATGARYRKLDVPRLEEFEGTSVYYAATQMEAMMCRGDPVVVVGGGNSAGQATLFLSRQAPMVRLAIRHDDLGRDMSRYLVDRIERTPNVEVLTCTEVTELVGERALEALVVRDMRSGEPRTIEARALFVFIGADPHTGWLGGQVELDEHGFILTGSSAVPRAEHGLEPSMLETSLPGVFAAGDVRSGSIKRVASAVGEGAMAVQMVHAHLHGRGMMAGA